MSSPLFSTDEFSSLKSKKICEYFPEDERLSTDHIVDQINFDDAKVKKFRHDFDRLVRHRKNFQGLSKSTSFKKWWDDNHGQYLTKPVVQNFKKNDITLGEFLDDLHFHFISNEVKKKGSSRVVRVLSRFTKARFFLAIAFSIAVVAHKCFYFVWNLLVLGPGVQMINSYTQPVITPMAQTAAQKGSKDLAGLATSIQAWLTNRDTLREVKSELHATTEKLQKIDFKSLQQDQIKAKWAEFETVYFTIFQRYNQALPSHLRDGRSFFRDWMVFTPIGLATNLAAFDTQYWMHKRELDQLKLISRQRHLTAEEQRYFDIHRKQMLAAESRMTGALAAWKIYEFMYPEFAHESQQLKASGDLKMTYNILADAMHFEVYVKQFSTRMAEVLKKLDADFLMQEEILQAAQGRTPAGEVRPN